MKQLYTVSFLLHPGHLLLAAGNRGQGLPGVESNSGILPGVKASVQTQKNKNVGGWDIFKTSLRSAELQS